MKITNETEAMQALALAKWYRELSKKQVEAVEAEARAFLNETVKPGDRRSVHAGDAEIATISKSKPNPRLRVTNERRYAVWLAARDYPLQYVQTLSGALTSEAYIKARMEEQGGEVPDGVEIVTPAPILSVRQSQAQADALTAHVEVARTIAENTRALELGAGDE